MNGETTKVGRLQALLDKVLVNAAALRDVRKAGASAPVPASEPAPVAAKAGLNAPRGGTLEPVPFVPERNLGGIAEFSTPAARPETEPVLLVKRAQPAAAPEPIALEVAEEVSPVAQPPISVVGEEFDPNTTAELPILEPEIEGEEPPLVLEPEISPVEPEPHYAGPSGEPAAPIIAEAEPSSSDRRAALNLEVPRAPAVPVLEPARAGDSLEAPPLPPVEMEVVDLETSGEELTTIPPSAPSAASSPHEPPPLELEADFGVPTVAEPAEADFSLSAPPQLEDIEAPPISTEQEREESDGLGVSLGFSPPATAPSVVEEDDDDRHGAPRTPPPESGPQVSLAPKEPEGLDVQTPSQPDFRTERGEGPTMEQVGSTISFSAEERVSRELELEESAIAAAKSAADDFEAELPKVGFSGAYDASLAPPATARQELAAHDREERERAERRSFVPGSGPVVTETAIPGALQGYPLETVSRSPVNVSSPAAIYDSTRGNVQPGSFLDRLEASLGLAGPSE